MSMSQSADFPLNGNFEVDARRCGIQDERPSWSDDAILSINTTKTNVDIQSGRPDGRHAAIKRKRARLLSKKMLHGGDGVSSASLAILSGQAANSERAPRPLPPPPPPHRVPMMGVGALAGPTVEKQISSESENSLPLLHRIVKTICIWYHADMDRSMAMKLLMAAEMGCFVLRKSSREKTLALTVRNARPHDCDHYLIFLRPEGLQIEGSFLTFQSIPKLIEYYSLHLRELPYLLKLPDPIANCSSDKLLEAYNNMGADFWPKYYPSNGSSGHQHRRHQPHPTVNETGISSDYPLDSIGRSEVQGDQWTLTSSVTSSLHQSSCSPQKPRLSTSKSSIQFRENYRSDVGTCARIPTATSVDSLIQRTVPVELSDRRVDQLHNSATRTASTPVEGSMHSFTGVSSFLGSEHRDPTPTSYSPEGNAKTRSVDSLNTGFLYNSSLNRAPDERHSGGDRSSYRSSVHLRVQRRSNETVDNHPSYDVMWEAHEGRLPLAESESPPTPPTNPTPPVAAPRPPSFDLARMPGFPQPNRFRPKFTFDTVTASNKVSATNSAPVKTEKLSAKPSIIYHDPIDLLPTGNRGAHDSASRPVPPPRRHHETRGGRPPVAKNAVGVELRGAMSDDSLHRRVEATMHEINKSIDAMEADLHPSNPSIVCEPPCDSNHQQQNDSTTKVPIRPLPIPVSSARSSTGSDILMRDSAQQKLHVDLTQLHRRRRLSQYDNVPVGSDPMLTPLQANSRQASMTSSRGTVFSNPWDTSVWHQLLQSSDRDHDTIEVLKQLIEKHNQLGPSVGIDSGKRRSTEADELTPRPRLLRTSSGREDDEMTPVPVFDDESLGPDDILHAADDRESTSGHDMVRRAQARISECVQPSSSRNVGATIDKWLTELTVNPQSLFGPKLQSFIECTRDANERNPHSVMRNIRQFMDGIKHYLVQRDETGFQKMIENERKKLAADEFLNVERRLESALYKLILKPLKTHLDNILIDWHHQAGNLRRVRDNIRLAAKHTPERLGIRNGLQPPSEEDLDQIRQCFKNMEAAYSPLVKLECLLEAVEVMYHNSSDADLSPQLLNTDDLMPIFTYVLVRCEVVSAELEAEYMQGLLASKFLLGEGAYYLSTLQAAVTVIKNFHRRPSVGNMTSSYEDLSQLHGVLRVHVLDERTDSTNMKTFPARPTMTARDLSILVAHRCHIFNPQDFSLYHFKDGKETLLKDLDLPYKIKVDCESRTEKPCHFLYRRTHAVFALPLGLSCGR